MSSSTCSAAAQLWPELDPAVWIRSFAEHLEECAECRSLFAGPELRSRALAYLTKLGDSAVLPDPTLECEQVDFLASSEGPLNVESFRTAYADHILGCRRCLRLVPTAIAPEVLAPDTDADRREAGAL